MRRFVGPLVLVVLLVPFSLATHGGGTDPERDEQVYVQGLPWQLLIPWQEMCSAPATDIVAYGVDAGTDALRLHVEVRDVAAPVSCPGRQDWPAGRHWKGSFVTRESEDSGNNSIFFGWNMKDGNFQEYLWLQVLHADAWRICYPPVETTREGNEVAITLPIAGEAPCHDATAYTYDLTGIDYGMQGMVSAAGRFSGWPPFNGPSRDEYLAADYV